MAGLRKAKKYEWKDSNLALFGSDLEKNVKKASAGCEKAWEHAGKAVGLQIWRIVKFKVTEWPKEDYGKFYKGDSYIILNTYKEDPSSEALSYDVHFWIGEDSSQDEYGTAAYKTVELDTFLDDKPVQHRQCQGFESNLFNSYFKKIVLLSGGADSGFRKVGPENYQPRLLEFCKGEDKKVRVAEKPFKKSSISNGDVYIIDLGARIIQWNGSESSGFERSAAQSFVQALESERMGRAKGETIDVLDINNLPDHLKNIFKDGDASDDEENPRRVPFEKVLTRLSDSSGSLEFKEISRGQHVKRSQLSSDDVFFLETEKMFFVWIGNGASGEERMKCFQYTHMYMIDSVNPYNPITMVNEGKENNDFIRAF